MGAEVAVAPTGAERSAAMASAAAMAEDRTTRIFFTGFPFDEWTTELVTGVVQADRLMQDPY